MSEADIYDIMLGTQMVAKGLDFPNVTVVGVIGADRALNSNDFRGYERTFSLLTQVVGRAGRSGDKGIAVIQTNDTDNNIISLAQAQDYDAFFNEEIANRKLMIYPPYCDICVVSVRSVSRGNAEKSINLIFDEIKKLDKAANKYQNKQKICLNKIELLPNKVFSSSSSNVP